MACSVSGTPTSSTPPRGKDAEALGQQPICLIWVRKVLKGVLTVDMGCDRAREREGLTEIQGQVNTGDKEVDINPTGFVVLATAEMQLKRP